MSYRVRFVDTDLATPLLDLADNSTFFFNEEASEIPLPEHDKAWMESIDRDGAEYVTGRYQNITITLCVTIRGTSVSDLDAHIRSVWAQATRVNILEFRPEGATASLFYSTFPYDKGKGTWHKKIWRREYYATLEFTLEAEPFAYAAEETIVVTDNLFPNASFEDYEETGQNTVFDDLTITRTNGSGTAYVMAATTIGQYLYGNTGLHLQITATNGVASVETTNYIEVDPGKHYYTLVNHYKASGSTSALKVKIKQYDNADTLLATITLAQDGSSGTYWKTLPQTIIHPSSETSETYHWNSSTVKVKVMIVVDTAIATYYVDGVLLTECEYLSANKLLNPAGLVIPPAAIKGDVPSPADIYLGVMFQGMTNSFLVGGRKEYHASYDPSLQATIGTDTSYPAGSVGGVFKSIDIGSELAVDGGFETYTGSGNTTNWTNWVETRSTYGTMEADTANEYAGSACVHFYKDGGAPTMPDSGSLTSSSYITVLPETDYVLSFRYKASGFSPIMPSTVKVTCYLYDSSNNGLGSTIDYPLTHDNASDYTLVSAIVNTRFAGAVKAKLTVSCSMYFSPDAYVDEVSMVKVEGTRYDFCVKDYVERIKGDVIVVPHYAVLTIAYDKDLTLASNLYHTTHGYIGDWYLHEEFPDQDLPSSFVWMLDPRFKRITIPTPRLADDADGSVIKQALRLEYDSALSDTNYIYADCMGLIPTDSGFVEIGAVTKDYLIIDCQSKRPGVLSALDGTKDTALAVTSGIKGTVDFKVNPRDGSNFALLHNYTDNYSGPSDICACNITLKYRPRYLVVA